MHVTDIYLMINFSFQEFLRKMGSKRLKNILKKTIASKSKNTKTIQQKNLISCQSIHHDFFARICEDW